MDDNGTKRYRVRVIKVTVQAELALDDGDTLTPMNPQLAEIPGREWRAYSAERFPREVADLERRIAVEPEMIATLIPEAPPTPPNRQQRRARKPRAKAKAKA